MNLNNNNNDDDDGDAISLVEDLWGLKARGNA